MGTSLRNRMAIKLAFSTAACPEWTLEEAARQAKAMGFAGLELRTASVVQGARSAVDPMRCEPEEVGRVLRGAGVEPVCLSTGVKLVGTDAAAMRGALGQTREALALAARMGCPAVRVFIGDVPLGESHPSFIRRASLQLDALANSAADAGVQLLIENAGGLTLAREWWTVVHLVDHPMIGLCWNVASAVEGGEKPTAAVSVLNTKIRLAKAADVASPGGRGVMLGEGAVGVQDYVKRLLGIGYNGWISLEWDRVSDPSLAPAESALPEAQRRLRGWLDEVAKAIEAAIPKPKPAKAEHAKPAAGAGAAGPAKEGSPAKEGAAGVAKPPMDEAKAAAVAAAKAAALAKAAAKKAEAAAAAAGQPTGAGAGTADAGASPTGATPGAAPTAAQPPTQS